jgi:hypothetical protein
MFAILRLSGGAEPDKEENCLDISCWFTHVIAVLTDIHIRGVCTPEEVIFLVLDEDAAAKVVEGRMLIASQHGACKTKNIGGHLGIPSDRHSIHQSRTLD